MSNIPRPSLDELEAYLKSYDEKAEKEAHAYQADTASSEIEIEHIKVVPAPVTSQKETVAVREDISSPTQQAEPEPTSENPPPEVQTEKAPTAAKKRRAKSKRKKSPLMKLWNIISTILVIAVILLAIALVGVRIIGYTPYAVLSPSMTPEFVPGDLIYVKEVPLNDIQVGDVISFDASEDGTIVTHRVAEVDSEGRKFYTKGDANESRDGNPVLFENVLGVVQFSIPKLGYVSNYVSSEGGRYVAIVIVLVLVLLWIVPELFRPEEKKEKIKDQDGI